MESGNLKKTLYLTENNAGKESKIVLGSNSVMQEVITLMECIKDLNSTVLITGESGTGKSLFAKVLHNIGKNRHYPFIHINCASLPEHLMESELFGHERGAFTGAFLKKPGKFELAEKGTLFLDEISTLSLALQAKLLVVLQENSFERIGGTKLIYFSGRIIAATNVDLEEAVRLKTIREDLYYRLNVIPISIPPLRSHKEDIGLLTDNFLKKYQIKFNRPSLKISNEVLALLKLYDWPGNVRELENTIEHAAALCKFSTISLNDLPIRLKSKVFFRTEQEVRGDISILKEGERAVIVEALLQHLGHRGRTASFLGMSRRTLQYKLKKYKLVGKNM